MSDDSRQRLRAAWDDLIADLQRARDAIDDPALMPPPPTPRNLAEGYRYLMGFVHHAVERAFHEDPERPDFRNALSIFNRSTIDNADAIYFYAPIDGRRYYRVRGEVGDHAAWRGDAPAATGRLAPHYVIFEATAGPMAGDSGDLRELAPGVKLRTGRLDSSAIEVAPSGRFEILVGPERPEGHTGNFIATRKRSSIPDPLDPEAPELRHATYLSGRQLFNDWEREDAIHLAIEPVSIRGGGGSFAIEPVVTPLPAYAPDRAAAELRRFASIVRGQMQFWNAFWTIPMGTYGPREGSIEGVAFPRNAFNRINAASGATGGGMSTNLYAGGVFELGPDEALVIENRVRRKPQYIGFQLGTPWGESMEYAHATGSLNGHQSEVDPDGVIRLVVAHRDPGVPNWLDTTGHPEGFLTPRWAYSETPPPEQWPGIRATKVPFEKIRAHLHPGTREMSPQERREQIRVRREHVQRRFRSF